MNHISLAIDIEPDWGRINGALNAVQNKLQYVLCLLESFNIKATFFCVGFVSMELRSQIKDIINGGHEIALETAINPAV